MKKISKHMEISCQSLGVAIFMCTVCIYMVVVAIFTWISNGDFYFNIPFAFLIQGVAISMMASIVWTLVLGLMKSWVFLARYFLALIILVALLGVSMLIPAINSTTGYFIWIISSFVSLFFFGTALAALSEKHFKKTGDRSVLVWEIQG